MRELCDVADSKIWRRGRCWIGCIFVVIGARILRVFCGFLGAVMRWGGYVFSVVFVLYGVVGFARVAADAGAPAGQRPVVLRTANVVPLVQITMPSGKGVSVNQYDRFDVWREGVVLNNSRDPVVETQIGGRVFGNPFLAGYRADLVIANPSGLDLDGVRVINAGRAAFVAGQTHIVDGGEWFSCAGRGDSYYGGWSGQPSIYVYGVSGARGGFERGAVRGSCMAGDWAK